MLTVRSGARRTYDVVQALLECGARVNDCHLFSPGTENQQVRSPRTGVISYPKTGVTVWDLAGMH